MRKYRVSFSGFAYVEAETPADAEELYSNDEYSYEEMSVDLVEEVDDFCVVL